MVKKFSFINIKVYDHVHQIAKLRAVERRLTLKDYVAALIIEDVARQPSAKAPDVHNA